MAFFSKNLYYIKFFSEMYYYGFFTKVDQEGGSIHEKKNLFPEIHILGPRKQTLQSKLKFQKNVSLYCVCFGVETSRKARNQITTGGGRASMQA